VGGKFFAVLKGNAAGAAVLDKIFSHGSFGADFDTGFAGGVGNGVGNGSRAAPAEAPGTECAVDFAISDGGERRLCRASESQEMCR